MLPLYIDPEAAAGVVARYAIHLRGAEGFVVCVDRGTVTIDALGSAADCHIGTDPVAMLLVAYGRKGQWSQILQAKMLAWGRKPWLALGSGDLFSDP